MTERKKDEISGYGVEGDGHPDKCAAEEINPSTKNWKIRLSFIGVPESFSGDKKSIKKNITEEEVPFTYTQAFQDLCQLHKWEDEGMITLKIEKEGESLFITVKHNKFDFCTLRRFEAEHLEIFNDPSYSGEFSTPEDEKCPQKIEPRHLPNGGLLPNTNRQHVAIAETSRAVAGDVDAIYTAETIRVPPKEGSDNDADIIDIPGFTQLPEIIPPDEQETAYDVVKHIEGVGETDPDEFPLFATPRGYKIYYLDFIKLVIIFEIKPEAMEVIEKIKSICEEEDLDMDMKTGRIYYTIEISKKEDTEYGKVMKNIINAGYLEEKKPRFSRK